MTAALPDEYANVACGGTRRLSIEEMWIILPGSSLVAAALSIHLVVVSESERGEFSDLRRECVELVPLVTYSSKGRHCCETSKTALVLTA